MDAASIMRISTELMLLALCIVSFSLFLLIASFRGKVLIDWLLMLRDLVLSIIAGRLFYLMVTGDEANYQFRLLQWTLMTVICLALFVALVRERLMYRKKVIPAQR